MADEAPTPEPDQQPDAASATEGPDAPELGDAGKKALDRMKAERDEAKREFKALQRELEKVRQSSLTEAERAVVEAEQRGRQAALADMGKRLARTQFEAVAARRNASYDVDSALDYLDLSRFLGDDGEPDGKAITAAVERLVPEPAAASPRPVGDADLGARPAPLALNGDGIENALRKKLGIA